MDIKTEDLLKALEQSKVEEKRISQDKSSVDIFIEKEQIMAGLDYVPTYVIYYKYCQSVEKPISKVHFFRLFSKKFKQARIGKQRRYLLDASKFDMSREGLLYAERFDKEKKENSKRNKKVSKSK